MEYSLNTKNKFVEICSCIAVFLIAILFVVISYAAIIETCRIDPANPYAELINFDKDKVLVNIAFIVLTILAGLAIVRQKFSIASINTNFILIVMVMVTSIVSLLWIMNVKSIASGDAMFLLNTARDAAEGQYGSFHSSYSYYGNYSYYLFYPFQLGYVFFAELLYHIFGTDSSDILFQVPNVIALNFIYVGIVMITKRLFNRKSLTNLTAIALIFTLQPMFMTTFTYGILLGLAFSVWSVYFTIRYMQTNKLLHAGLAVLLIAIAVLLKYNNMIVMAAICISLILHTIDKKKFIALAVAALMVVCSVGLQKIVIASYASRSDAELDTQVSQTLYAYMGISDSNMAPGWYNGLAMETLRDNHMDVDAANEVASEGIKNRLDYLVENDQLGEFMKKKLFSQLNEPSFESIWLSQVREHDLEEGEELSKVVTSVYTGGLNKLLDIWFNFSTMMIYIFFAAGMVWMYIRKKMNPGTIILPVAVLGGILYHMLFEAKSQYLLPYFILLIPFAAYGFIESIKALKKPADHIFSTQKKVRADNA